MSECNHVEFNDSGYCETCGRGVYSLFRFEQEENNRLRESIQGMVKRPTIDWIGTDAPDPRDAYSTRINGHVVGIHSTEEAARNHAWALEAYLDIN